MSVESARDFLLRVETDKALKDRLEAVPDLKSRWRIIQANGGDFSMEEFKQAVEEMKAASGQELTPEELRDIAGGGGWCPCKGPHYNYLRL
jgi:predicted ribosomally synthesized peptide with nif11-like leader